jgi:glycosyltransferase involved in cell wall biosynthesis
MISVILASHNGQNVLPLTLDAFVLLEQPQQGVEFIIVDNASTDRTTDVIETYLEKLTLKNFKENRKGKAFAIHKGISESSGELIIFTDDDVVPQKDWLIEYEKLANENAEYAFFLGQIRPYWLKKPPAWLVDLTNIGRSCGCTSIDTKDGEISFHAAKGANMAVHRELLEKISFRTDLWIAGVNQVGGEDTDFAKKAVELGFHPLFSSKIKILHIVKPHEMTVVSIWKRYVRIGRSMAAVDSVRKHHGALWFGYPRWVVVDITKRGLIVMRHCLFFRRFRAVSELIDIAIIYGKAFEIKNSQKM